MFGFHAKAFVSLLTKHERILNKTIIWVSNYERVPELVRFVAESFAPRLDFYSLRQLHFLEQLLGWTTYELGHSPGEPLGRGHTLNRD